MKKGLIWLAASAVLLMGLAGCGKTAFSGKAVEPQKWAQTILSGAKFTDQLTQLGDAAALKRYSANRGDVDSCAVYVGTGSTAEEFAVWKLKDEKAAEGLLKNAQTLLAAQESSYADYKPAEVPKLKSAVAEQRDNIVVICVSSDNTAAKRVIDGLFDGE